MGVCQRLYTFIRELAALRGKKNLVSRTIIASGGVRLAENEVKMLVLTHPHNY